MTSNTPETQALLPVTAEARAAAEAHLPPMFWKEAAIADLAHAFTRFERDTIARHRQSSSNAGGVDVSALWKVHDALVAHHQWHAAQTEPDPEHGFIPADEYADSGLYEQTVAAIGVLDPYLRSGPRDTEALASLSTPTAEPPPTPDRIGKDAVREALAFIDKFFEPWGAWKTAWWEGEVSDDAAFSADNALKHVANILRRATPAQEGGR